ncbi:uncharacterized protein LOC120332736 [Styela clava]
MRNYSANSKSEISIRDIKMAQYSSTPRSHILLLCLLLLALAISTSNSAPSYRPHFNQMNIIQKIKFLERKLSLLRNRKTKCHKQVPDAPKSETPDQNNNENTDWSQRIRQTYERVTSSCGLIMQSRCKTMTSRCHVSMLSKRSIPEDENGDVVERVKRSSYSVSRRNRGKKIKVTCNMCRINCWS